MTALVTLLTVVASMIAGHPTNVVCGPVPAGEAGFFVPTPVATITLSPASCKGIQDYRNGVYSIDSASGVLMLAHESEHATLRPDWRDETNTECRAIAVFPAVANILGNQSRPINYNVMRRNTLRLLGLAEYVHHAERSFPGYGTHPCTPADL
jgi:hypothetical protein